MKALGGREAKQNVSPAAASRLDVRFAHVSLRRNFVVVLSRPGGMKAGYAQRDEGGHLAGALARRERIGRSVFDGHVGIREVVQTVRDGIAADRSLRRIWE